MGYRLMLCLSPWSRLWLEQCVSGSSEPYTGVAMILAIGCFRSFFYLLSFFSPFFVPAPSLLSRSLVMITCFSKTILRESRVGRTPFSTQLPVVARAGGKFLSKLEILSVFAFRFCDNTSSVRTVAIIQRSVKWQLWNGERGFIIVTMAPPQTWIFKEKKKDQTLKLCSSKLV